MERIPQNVSEAVRVAAGAARGYPGDLADIHRRARRRRNRQVALSAAAVVAVFAGTGAGVALRQPVAPIVQRTTAPASAPSQPAPSQAAPAAKDPAQHLVLDDGIGTYRVPDGKPVTLGGEKALGELLPDGGLRALPVVGATTWEKAVVLPDGGLVVLANHDIMPEVKRDDGPGAGNLEYRLMRVNPAGEVTSYRNIRREGESVTLVAATATTAHLWRRSGLTKYDLATNNEYLVVDLASAGLGAAGGVRHLDVSSNRLAVADTADECAPRVYDIATLRKLADRSLKGCLAVNRMRLSPDGSTLAVTYQTDGSGNQPPSLAALIRVADGKVLAQRELPGDRSTEYSTMTSIAWQDDRTLRIADYPVAAPGTAEIAVFTLTTG